MTNPDKDLLQDQLGFIYIHIPKTAGRSMVTALGAGINNQHKNISHYLKTLGAETVASRYKFSIVRNPWDRAVSWYKFFTAGMSSPSNSPPPFEEWVVKFASRKNNQLDEFSYLRDEAGSMIVDHLIQFENLDSGYAGIRAEMGARGAQMPEIYPSVGKHDQLRISWVDGKPVSSKWPETYREFYTTPESIQAVADCNADLIKMFGYKFK